MKLLDILPSGAKLIGDGNVEITNLTFKSSEARGGSLQPFVAEAAVVVGDVQLRPRGVDFLVYTSGGRSGAVAAGKTCGAGERHRYCERAAGKF